MGPKKPATYQDIIDLPENMVGQIVDGELHATPRPAAPHTILSSYLGGMLIGASQARVRGPGGWLILDEPEIHLQDDILVPDLAGWKWPRVPSPVATYFTLAPDWICEILSPSTASFDRKQKMPVYWRECVGHAWVIDPRARTLEAFRRAPQEREWIPLGTWEGDHRIRVEPFDALELDLSWLWELLTPQPSP
jgi:Uma2 family endonuclease